MFVATNKTHETNKPTKRLEAPTEGAAQFYFGTLAMDVVVLSTLSFSSGPTGGGGSFRNVGVGNGLSHSAAPPCQSFSHLGERIIQFCKSNLLDEDVSEIWLRVKWNGRNLVTYLAVKWYQELEDSYLEISPDLTRSKASIWTTPVTPGMVWWGYTERFARMKKKKNKKMFDHVWPVETNCDKFVYLNKLCWTDMYTYLILSYIMYTTTK